MASQPSTRASKRPSRYGVGTVLPDQVENEIVEWIWMLRRSGIPVPDTLLDNKAIEVAQTHRIVEFSASRSWRKSFKKRHDLATRRKTRSGQAYQEQGDEVRAAFGAKIRNLIATHKFSNVYNADQTAINF
ncbi:unnamed protein product, partial [Aphanomyces euteiches]